MFFELFSCKPNIPFFAHLVRHLGCATPDDHFQSSTRRISIACSEPAFLLVSTKNVSHAQKERALGWGWERDWGGVGALFKRASTQFFGSGDGGGRGKENKTKHVIRFIHRSTLPVQGPVRMRRGMQRVHQRMRWHGPSEKGLLSTNTTQTDANCSGLKHFIASLMHLGISRKEMVSTGWRLVKSLFL